MNDYLPVISFIMVLFAFLLSSLRPSIFDHQPYLLCPYTDADVPRDKLLTRKFLSRFYPVVLCCVGVL